MAGMKRLVTVALAVTLTAAAAHAGDRPLRVIDGDTFRAGRERLRIENLDAPDIGDHAKCALEAQRGARSAAYARELVDRGPVTIWPIGRRDRYGRELVRVSIGSKDFATLMIAAGLGRPWRGRSSDWCRN